MKNFKNIIKVLGLVVFVASSGFGSVSKTFADTAEAAQVESLPEPQMLQVKPGFENMAEAVKSYDAASVVDVDNNGELTNDLALNGGTFFRVNVVCGFSGGELKENDEATGRTPRKSVLEGVNAVRFVFLDDKNQVVLQKNAVKNFMPGEQQSNGVRTKDSLSFYADVKSDEIPFGHKYLLKIYNAENNKLLGYIKDYGVAVQEEEAALPSDQVNLDEVAKNIAAAAMNAKKKL